MKVELNACKFCSSPMLPFIGSDESRPMWECNTWTSANGSIDQSKACKTIALMRPVVEAAHEAACAVYGEQMGGGPSFYEVLSHVAKAWQTYYEATGNYPS